MDISKYIGLYLVKNEYCSLPSLGTLQLEKKGAKKLDSNSIVAPQYNITFNTIGSIDDKFPNFIAINENISTNNASNAINVFGREIKEEIAKKNSYVIEGLGKFYNENGKMCFQQNSDLDLSSFTQVMPEQTPNVFENNKVQQTDQEIASTLDFKTVMNQPQKESNFNLAKVLLPIGLLAIIGVGGYFGYKYLQKPASNLNNTTTTTDTSLNTTAHVIKDTIKKNNVDSNTHIASTNTISSSDTTHHTVENASGPAIKVAILTYHTEAEANAKSKKLISFKNNTSVLKTDSNTYKVVINLPATSKPANLIVDSLRRFFNPSEKMGKVEEIK